ncbi:MAG: chromosomal replication initiator protein DnaA [Bacteroidaceae bacterium]|nr:chromosomal replication initiator protein DnaA [Bacteroidaceae bacterium]MBQ3238372.1 chromosomal replication initiator protein DnaA [Bacteroidaceae bacterium]MBQ7968079.1 chromosomal replication initiator protein DnaA [Bacteroidaceae bacterium]MBR4042525.1 chromosomal replication initiator protein DnaA [Bacteroidaceae bacterium]
MTETQLTELWGKCLDIIRDNLPSETAFNTWFASTRPASYAGNVLTIYVPSQFVYEYIEEHYVNLLSAAIYRVFGNDTQLNYRVLVVADEKEPGMIEQPATPKRTVKIQPTEQKSGNKTPGNITVPAQDLDPMLRSNYSFDNFIEGLSNKLPRAAAESIAQKPGKTVFNPLFLYGASGVGKTHLANAIGLKVKELYPEKRVLYVSAHLFKVQYTDSVRKNTLNDFINFYQSIDVLIIDDIQEFVGVEKTQNTFFHIFNHLHQNGKQLIMTCDRPPVMLQGIEERLITRFKWGLTAEIERPNLDLRRNILADKVRREGISVTPNVLEYIAENVTDSVRELEGILISLMAHSTIYGRDIDLAMAERVISKAVRVNEKEITVEDIVHSTCEYYHIKDESIYSSSRKRDIVLARQIAMYLTHKHLPNLSLARIGQQIGSKDHSTVLHACRTIEEQLEVDKAIEGAIEDIEVKIKSR